MSALIVDMCKMLVPGSPALLVCGVAGAAPLLFWPRTRPWCVGLLLALGSLYFALSLPWTANRIAESLYRHGSVRGDANLGDVSTVVVLDGDHQDGRIKEAARLYRDLAPLWVVVSGPPDFRDAMVRRGIPSDRIIWEHRARTTREQVLQLVPLLRAHQVDRIVLVASPLHMWRAVEACRAVGIGVTPSVSERPHPNLPRRTVSSIKPGLEALGLSYDALYEWVAMGYYSVHGWVKS